MYASTIRAYWLWSTFRRMIFIRNYNCSYFVKISWHYLLNFSNSLNNHNTVVHFATLPFPAYPQYYILFTLLRMHPLSLQVSIRHCPWPRPASKLFRPARVGPLAALPLLLWVIISLMASKWFSVQCSFGANWLHHMPFVCKHHHVTYPVWWRWLCHIRANSFARVRRDVLSMFVSENKFILKF